MHASLKGKWSCIQQRTALPFWRSRGSLLDEKKLLLLFFYMGNERTTASSKCDLRTLTSRCLTFGFKPCFKINFWHILTFLLWILGEKIKKKSLCWYLFFLSFVNQRFYGMYIRTQSLSRVWLFYNPVNCRLPGSSVHGIFQARILEQVAISYSRGSSWHRDQTHVSCISCIARGILYHCATREALYGTFQFKWTTSIHLGATSAFRSLLLEERTF